jgi:DNA methylase
VNKILTGDCLKKLKTLKANSVHSMVTDPPAGISFMGKSWDDDKGGRKQWIAWMSSVMVEAMRVMKPGAHGLVWAIPRTSHWTATALEDAGFEIRDVVTHLFGSGFPKSLDVSKAIDKAAGHWRGKSEGVASENKAMSGGNYLRTPKGNPITPSASAWAGWGTALKPASEHWILIRKPCSEKTVAANVLKWGCGAINIDASRIGTQEFIGRKSTEYDKQADGWGLASINKPGNTQGRFPANLVLDEEAAAMLDEQSGISKSTGGRTVKRSGAGYVAGKGSNQVSFTNDDPGFGDVGGASRFFYCAKASKSDKNAGLEGMPKVKGGSLRGKETRADRPTNHPFNENHHPTVKSTKLMSYLITLVTPPGGTVLDPFTGSGSSGVAAKKFGFKFIGIERDREYVKIAKRRIEACSRSA